jgi:hypothetical protein
MGRRDRAHYFIYLYGVVSSNLTDGVQVLYRGEKVNKREAKQFENDLSPTKGTDRECETSRSRKEGQVTEQTDVGLKGVE